MNDATSTTRHTFTLQGELRFLLALWKANLLAAMEFRVSFISQVLGMMLNDAMYFIFWVLFFDRFKDIRGWQLNDMVVLFGIVAATVGLANFLFGNLTFLSDVILTGRLDYYLSLPRPVLLHVLASRSQLHGLGDVLYGVLSFIIAGHITLDAFGRYLLAVLMATMVYVGFLVLVQSLAFWLGSAQLLSQQAMNAMITFSIYPITLFDGTAKLLLFTLVPAALVGALPAAFVESFSWAELFELAGVAVLFFGASVAAFQGGMKRYESGSAIQVQM